MMPKMDGIETVKRIREAGYTHPVVALTANAIIGQADIFMENDFDGFLTKPIDVRQLNNVLNKMIRDKQSIVILEEAQRDKIRIAEDARKVVVTETDFFRMLDGIKEIDKETGLSLAAGEKDLYKMFLSHIYKTLPSHCDTLTSHLESGNIQAFATSVHGVKSALSGVGAMALSEIALTLEIASKGGDSEYCVNNYPAFLQKLKEFHTRLSVIMPGE
jgi:HPt (histidine-containing phosphotransfer) domain-containing protein